MHDRRKESVYIFSATLIPHTENKTFKHVARIPGPCLSSSSTSIIWFPACLNV